LRIHTPPPTVLCAPKAIRKATIAGCSAVQQDPVPPSERKEAARSVGGEQRHSESKRQRQETSVDSGPKRPRATLGEQEIGATARIVLPSDQCFWRDFSGKSPRREACDAHEHEPNRAESNRRD